MAHLLEKDKCYNCMKALNKQPYYIHHPCLCSYYHADAADQVKRNRDLRLAEGILSTTVGGGTLAVGAGRLAVVGKVGQVTTKCIGGALAALCVVTSVIDIVDASTEKAPELPKCKRCNKAEADQPGCLLVCQGCGVECSSWKDASATSYCYKVCKECYNSDVCMKCHAAPATRKLHQAAKNLKIHRSLSTHLYGTCQAGRITGSSLTIAGTAVTFIPVIGWFAGPALIAGGVGTSIGSAVASKPTVKVRCGECKYEATSDDFAKSKGCEEWCFTCGVRSSSQNKYCLALCNRCEQD